MRIWCAYEPFFITKYVYSINLISQEFSHFIVKSTEGIIYQILNNKNEQVHTNSTNGSKQS